MVLAVVISSLAQVAESQTCLMLFRCIELMTRRPQRWRAPLFRLLVQSILDWIRMPDSEMHHRLQ